MKGRCENLHFFGRGEVRSKCRFHRAGDGMQGRRVEWGPRGESLVEKTAGGRSGQLERSLRRRGIGRPGLSSSFMHGTSLWCILT